jgi:hypothetical protein
MEAALFFEGTTLSLAYLKFTAGRQFLKNVNKQLKNFFLCEWDEKLLF